ncbi:hypothetical protein FJZ39_00630 [Candidatus Saccharibacteria bacterium]|nr:hypothetical protein [Candidatus Saccharibacteria bacterium]
MGLYLQQKNDRSKLQERITAELREKAARQGLGTDALINDGVEDSRYVENTKKTTSLAWVWVVIGVFAAAIVIFFISQTSA